MYTEGQSGVVKLLSIIMDAYLNLFLIDMRILVLSEAMIVLSLYIMAKVFEGKQETKMMILFLNILVGAGLMILFPLLIRLVFLYARTNFK